MIIRDYKNVINNDDDNHNYFIFSHQLLIITLSNISGEYYESEIMHNMCFKMMFIVSSFKMQNVVIINS